MRNFRVKLTKLYDPTPFGNVDEPASYEGKICIDEKGIIKGFVKNYSLKNSEYRKSYIVGVEGKNTIKFVQLWVDNRGDMRSQRVQPISYTFDCHSRYGIWEMKDEIRGYEYYRWKNNLDRGVDDSSLWEGAAEMDKEKIKSDPLQDNEKKFIVKIIEMNQLLISDRLGVDKDVISTMLK